MAILRRSAGFRALREVSIDQFRLFRLLFLSVPSRRLLVGRLLSTSHTYAFLITKPDAFPSLHFSKKTRDSKWRKSSTKENSTLVTVRVSNSSLFYSLRSDNSRKRSWKELPLQRIRCSEKAVESRERFLEATRRSAWNGRMNLESRRLVSLDKVDRRPRNCRKSVGLSMTRYRKGRREEKTRRGWITKAGPVPNFSRRKWKVADAFRDRPNFLSKFSSSAEKRAGHPSAGIFSTGGQKLWILWIIWQRSFMRRTKIEWNVNRAGIGWN